MLLSLSTSGAKTRSNRNLFLWSSTVRSIHPRPQRIRNQDKPRHFLGKISAVGLPASIICPPQTHHINISDKLLGAILRERKRPTPPIFPNRPRARPCVLPRFGPGAESNRGIKRARELCVLSDQPNSASACPGGKYSGFKPWEMA